MRRFEENTRKDRTLDKVFTFLRGRKRGFLFRVMGEDGNEREVKFVRRGQDHVSVIDPLTNKPELVPLEQVIVE